MLDPATTSPLHLIEGIPIAPEEVCPCCRPLLFHHEYMTVYLERQYNCHIHLKKIAQWHHHNDLIRQVFLNDEANRTYIVSQIKIYLTQFSLAIQEQLIHSNLPFGRILSELKIKPIFSKRRFLKRMAPFTLEFDTTPARFCNNHFGRFHQILDHRQQVLADVYEWIA